MKKDTVKKRRSIDFSKGIRGKYADMDLVIVGAAPKQKRIESKAAEAVLKKVSRVLDSPDRANESWKQLLTALEI